MDTPLLDRTLELLAQSDVPMKEIALGADVEYSWLKQIRRQHLTGKGVGDPGVTRIEKVYKYLSARTPAPQALSQSHSEIST